MVVGRFAPSPTGRMHLGNVWAALLSWLSAKSQGGRWILRIEDLDPQRSRREYALQLEDDLRWLGLHPDEGGLDGLGEHGPYCQSERSHHYQDALDRLHATGLTYPCTCTRADIMATQAPHRSDGRVVYAGTCRPPVLPCHDAFEHNVGRAAIRLAVPDSAITFDDRLFGPQSVRLTRECGDFVLRRADGAWAYQLAVVVDDALMGVTEVVRGCDLMPSAAQQVYLYRLLGYTPPRYMHLPLLVNEAGQRLSKRDASLSMAQLRQSHSAEQIIGLLAHYAGLNPDRQPLTPASLLTRYTPGTLPATPAITLIDPYNLAPV